MPVAPNVQVFWKRKALSEYTQSELVQIATILAIAHDKLLRRPLIELMSGGFTREDPTPIEVRGTPT